MRRAVFRFLRGAAFALLVVVAGGCEEDSTAPSTTVAPELYAGGRTTIFNATSQAFTFPSPNLADPQRHLAGDVAFEAAFVSAPAATNGGLGPLFNSNACSACHVSNGRGRPPQPGEPAQTMLIRLSVPGRNPDGHGGPNPAPGFGGQLNDKSLFPLPAEAEVTVSYEEITGRFADGETYSLRKPTVSVTDPYVELPPDLLVSARVAPPVFGRGLLEAVPEAEILSLADELDADGDGISGKPNYVWDVVGQRTALGRFGLKANEPSLVQQAAAAYRNDMGVTNPLFPTDSAHGQSQADGLADDPEITMETVELAAFYTQTLAVPARRSVDDPRVQRGARVFDAAGCASCHTPKLRTGVLDGVPSVSNETIYPYTDMLLHDMGDDLADGRADFLADGNEWRTPPLWGLGLTQIVNGHTDLLHDGRARNVLEAILWHGGEARSARDYVIHTSRRQREDLLAFLASL